MSEELKACPFCGGEPVMEQYARNGIRIKCSTCGVKREQRVLRQTLEWLRDAMTKSWNRRKSAEGGGEIETE